MYFVEIEVRPGDAPLYLHDPYSKTNVLVKGSITEVLNAVNDFKFELLPMHPVYNVEILPYISLIHIRDKNDDIIFRGRVVDVTRKMTNNGEMVKEYVVECELAYLLDSMQEAEELVHVTVDEYFMRVLSVHNFRTSDQDKRISYIRVNHGSLTPVPISFDRDCLCGTVRDTYHIQYVNTFQNIQNNILNKLSGYIWLEYLPDGDRVLHYSVTSGVLREMPLELAVNLENMISSYQASQDFTRLIPLGSELERYELAINRLEEVGLLRGSAGYWLNEVQHWRDGAPLNGQEPLSEWTGQLLLGLSKLNYKHRCTCGNDSGGIDLCSVCSIADFRQQISQEMMPADINSRYYYNEAVDWLCNSGLIGSSEHWKEEDKASNINVRWLIRLAAMAISPESPRRGNHNSPDSALHWFGGDGGWFNGTDWFDRFRPTLPDPEPDPDPCDCEDCDDCDGIDECECCECTVDDEPCDCEDCECEDCECEDCECVVDDEPCDCEDCECDDCDCDDCECTVDDEPCDCEDCECEDCECTIDDDYPSDDDEPIDENPIDDENYPDDDVPNDNEDNPSDEELEEKHSLKLTAKSHQIKITPFAENDSPWMGQLVITLSKLNFINYRGEAGEALVAAYEAEIMADIDDIEAYEDAIDSLANAGVIHSPNYWKQEELAEDEELRLLIRLSEKMCDPEYPLMMKPEDAITWLKEEYGFFTDEEEMFWRDQIRDPDEGVDDHRLSEWIGELLINLSLVNYDRSIEGLRELLAPKPIAPIADFGAYNDALDSLSNAGAISSPDYWKEPIRRNNFQLRWLIRLADLAVDHDDPHSDFPRPRLTIKTDNQREDWLPIVTGDDVPVVEGIVIFDTNDPVELRQMAYRWIAENQTITNSVSISAVDLSYVDDINFESFNVGDEYQVINPLLGIDGAKYPLISKRTDIVSPIKSSLTFGGREITMSSSR